MTSILQKIIQTKYQEVLDLNARTNLDELHNKADSYIPKGFKRALLNDIHSKNFAIISEIKKASPSKGVIAKNFDPIKTAQAYQNAGASCLSVLTDKQYFQGSDDYLTSVRQVSDLPILRKDFMIDTIQIIQAKALGADCILLIMACLDDDTFSKLYHTASDLGLDVLIEIHDEQERMRAMAYADFDNVIFGINNRNLNSFEVDLNNSIYLANKITTTHPNLLVVSESGIDNKDDIHTLQSHGIRAYLIGEQFMKADNAGLALSCLINSL